LTDLERQRVLLVEDEDAFAQALTEYLESHGLQVQRLDDLERLFPVVETAAPRGIILDQLVRGMDSLALVSQLRQRFHGGLMIVAATDEATDRVLALELGADDVVGKSLALREVLARLRAMLRRFDAARVPVPPAQPAWRLDRARKELISGEETGVRLTSLEFELLALMEAQRGHVLSRDELSAALLHRPYSPLDRAVDNLVAQLRRKLESFPQAANAIRSVRGVGYVFVGFGAPPGA